MMEAEGQGPLTQSTHTRSSPPAPEPPPTLPRSLQADGRGRQRPPKNHGGGCMGKESFWAPGLDLALSHPPRPLC